MALFSNKQDNPMMDMYWQTMQSGDPYEKLGAMLGLGLGKMFGGEGWGGTPKQLQMAWSAENLTETDFLDPTKLKQKGTMAIDAGFPDLGASLFEESFSLAKELAKAAASATKDRDVSPMTDKNADAIEKFLSSKEIEGGTENYSLINDIHTWSQKKNWSYDQALEYLLNTKYQSLPSSSWFGRDFKLTPRSGEGTAAAVQQPTVSNAEEENKRYLENLRAGK